MWMTPRPSQAEGAPDCEAVPQVVAAAVPLPVVDAVADHFEEVVAVELNIDLLADDNDLVAEPVRVVAPDAEPVWEPEVDAMADLVTDDTL